MNRTTGLLAAIAVAAALFAAPANARKFDTIKDQCEELQEANADLRCVLAYQPELTLLVRMHWNSASPEAVRKRNMRQLRAVTTNFMALGGRWIVLRTVSPEGKLLERPCNQVRNTVSEFCYEWREVEAVPMDAVWGTLER